MSDPMVGGGCLCGAVRYEIAGPVGSPVMCHCSMCRRASGSAFAVNAGVRAEDFHIVAGADLTREYESSPGKVRVFCSRCGSPLYGRFVAHPEFVRLRLGTLDGDASVRPVMHVWVGSKAPWFEITDTLHRVEDDGS